MIEEDRREGREEGRRRRRSTCTARKREEEQERESTRWSRDEQRAVLERRMADRNEDFNWYPGLSLSLSLSFSGQAARSFCYCFFLSAFSLSFSPRPLFPAASRSFLLEKRFTEAIAAARLRSSGLFVYRRTFTEIAARCAGARSRPHTTRALDPPRGRERRERERPNG